MDQGSSSPNETDENSDWPGSRYAGPPLMPLIASGDAAAVDRFIERYGGLIWTLTRRMTRSRHDAEDLVQEIFLELWKHAAQFRPERGSEVSFIAVVAKRRLFDHLRKRNSTPQVSQLSAEAIAGATVGGIAEPAERQTDPLELGDEIAKVRNCLGQLSPSTQQVLKLVLQEGLSHQDVSNSLKLPLGSVKSFARRGLLSLRDCVRRPLTNFQEAGS